MDSLPLVSVITPVFNAEKWISQSYEQVRNQTYSRIEIIYIDNASTDNTLAKLMEIAQEDERVKVFTESEKGAGSARNKGIQEAEGELITFLDVDDKIEPIKIERHVEIFIQNPQVQLVYGKELKVYEDASKSFEIPRDPGEPGIKKVEVLAMHFLGHFGRLPGMNSVSCRRQAALDVGGFETKLLRGEDAAFLVKIALKYPCYYDDYRVGTYYRHGQSTTSTDNKRIAGSPYYIQFRDFYLPYFNTQFQGLNKSILLAVSRKTGLELLRDARLRFGRKQERRKYIKKELAIMDMPGRHKTWIRCLSLLPDSIQIFGIKMWGKLGR